MAETTGPPGLDLDRLGAWMASAVAQPAGPLSADVIAGGKSNLTYVVTDGRERWIVRRPPLGHVLATAHDMGREFRVMSALHATDVPVPRTHALCTDDTVVGAPFYVMELVEGRPYKHASDLVPLGRARTRAISESLVDTLVTLHAIDPGEIGLSDFGRPVGFLGRQVRRWHQQLQASHTRDLPLAEQLHAQLASDVPEESAAGIVHGDFRLDNVLVDEQDRPAAVIDWEMATLGDPLTDLALMVVYGRLGELAAGNEVVDVASAPGFLSETKIVDRYAAASPRDLSRFGFHLGLASFKLAAILEGVHYRYVHGQTVGEGFAHIGELVPVLLDGGLRAMKENS